MLFRPRPALLRLSLLCSLIGCAEAPPPGPPMPLEQVLASLVEDATFREVLDENAEAPVRVATAAPQTTFSSDTGPLPALILPPAARVHFRLGSLGSGYELQFGIGFDRTAYRGQDSGSVRFRCQKKGLTLFEATLPFGPEVPKAQQTWQLATLNLEDVSEFTLETTLVSGSGLPSAAFASLELVALDERPREKTTLDKPNIVLIVVDTLRFDRLGCYGNARGLTPNLDALAQRGTLFEYAFSAAPWTWPSTASILTGLSPAEHGVTSHTACYLAHDLQTLPEALQRAGWSTGGFSNNPLISSCQAFDQGFEVFKAREWGHCKILVDDALAWLDNFGDWRFLLYLQFIDPHDYHPAAEQLEQFAGQEPEGFKRSEARQLLKNKVLGEPYDDEKLRVSVSYISDLYDAAVAEVDGEIGRLIAELKARGLFEQTIFVVTSDHGEEFLDHGFLYHGAQLYRELVGVPLIFAGPGIAEGQRFGERVENRSIASTLLELVDVDAPQDLRGLNLLDSEAAKAAALEPSFVSTSLGIWPQASGPAWHAVTIHGVRLGDELLLWVPEGPDGSSAAALFDLQADPEARTNIAGERPARCDVLRRLIQRWLERGAARRPDVRSGGAAVLEQLRKLGYVDR